MTRLRARGAVLLGTLLLAVTARGDGGTLILREERGPLVVTLLAEPIPLRAGPVGFDVLVQSLATGEPLLSADVLIRLLGPGAAGAHALEVHAQVSGNRLFRGARVSLPSPGTWRVEVLVTGPEGREAAFHAPLELAAAQGPVRRYWAYIAATPLGLALLALHQARSLCVRRGRRTSASARRAHASGGGGLP